MATTTAIPTTTSTSSSTTSNILNPGPYHEIDRLIRNNLDYVNEFEPGFNLTFQRAWSKRLSTHNTLAYSPLYFKQSISTQLNDGTSIVLLMDNDKEMEAEITTSPLPNVTTKVSLNSTVSAMMGKQQPVIFGTLCYTGDRYVSEVKLTTKNDGLFGLSHMHAVNARLTAGFEAYYKAVQKSGGASFGLRYQGKYRNFPFQVCSTYNVMGDLGLSFHSPLVTTFPTDIDLATRFTLNTNSMESRVEIGSTIVYSLKVGKRVLPMTLLLSTSSAKVHAARLNFKTNIGKISLGAVIENKRLSYGLSLNI
ncbi:hypothetical protein SAMD00019534_062400 [Acytostelium subglobosum LB1]|uniref:hypothetical protein n=1 Tax=Acytostelium subglobosum LB1 TaxID=1410327 RepID=UPI0006448425|nr:hypothetical protein SAMD00019534_062400 [Acytostelium subglobosum LB1]GAM23065.1 hypothetical protein SAMD00019534_062400 [Acytostelium subglobosum LB1]|eukprot:XP_012754292.1 hypothetical protein SAMD00019534_062400 [Acytostelium subglobosum LB1]